MTRDLPLAVLFALLALIFVPGVISAAAPITLEGHNWTGEPFRLSDLRGKVVAVFFGYTSCPHECPLTMSTLRATKARLGQNADAFSVVFVTVDPATDTREKLKSYVAMFDPAFFGVRVEPSKLASVLAAFGASASPAPTTSRNGSLMNHSGAVFLVDRTGQVTRRVPWNAEVRQLAADVARLIDGKDSGSPTGRR